MTEQYEAVTEGEWKTLATTEITHLTDEEKDYLPRAWDEWIARVRRDAKAEALRDAVENVDVGSLADAWTHGAITRLSVTNAVAEVLMSLRNRATEYETGDQA